MKGWVPKKRHPAPSVRHAGDPRLADGFHRYLLEYLAWMAAMNYADVTIKNRRIELGYFIDWCEGRGIARPPEVTRALIEQYRQHIFGCLKAGDKPLSFNTQGKRLQAVKLFFQWLARRHYVLFNPAGDLEMPRQEKNLPRHVLTVAEVEHIINTADVNDPSGLGLRDRAMMEVLYSTGMRRGEVLKLRLDDLDRERGSVLIRQGKGKKDRVVPIGERALAWLDKYLYEVRARYLDPGMADPGFLFLASHGIPMSGAHLSYLVKCAIEKAALERFAQTHPIAACHLFRHACATHMLEAGADIRYIQILLGHVNLNTTQVYTRVSILQLKAVHEKTHPARLMPRSRELEEHEHKDQHSRA